MEIFVVHTIIQVNERPSVVDSDTVLADFYPVFQMFYEGIIDDLLGFHRYERLKNRDVNQSWFKSDCSVFFIPPKSFNDNIPNFLTFLNHSFRIYCAVKTLAEFLVGSVTYFEFFLNIIVFVVDGIIYSFILS